MHWKKPPMNIENTIHTTLKTIRDPLLNMTPHEMGLTPKITEHHEDLHLELRAHFPIAFLEKSLLPLLKEALTKVLPHRKITLTLTSFIRAHLTQLQGSGLRGVKNTIAIASGKGGVGKSTVTVNMAVALARAGARVGILDADIYGPSIPLMLGKVAPVQIQGEHYLPIKAHGVQAMSIGYLTQGDEALIWRGPMLAKSLIQMLDITQWDDLDYLFIDLPPGTGDIQLSLVQKIPLTAAVVVTTPQQIATLDAQKAINMFNKTGIHVLGLIENMSLHTCSQCGHQEPLFGTGGALKLSETHHCKLLGQLPLNSTIGLHSDEGNPITANSDDEFAQPFIKAALMTSIELGLRPLNYADRFPPIVVG